MTLPGIDFINKILCEEIRQEKSNKYILLGVYSGNILLSALPAHIPLALFIEHVVATPGDTTYWLRFSGPGEGQFAMKLNAITTQEQEIVHVTTPRLDVLMECEGTLKIEVSADNESWQSVIEKTVTQADGLWSLAPPIASLQHSEQFQPYVSESAKPPAPSRRVSPTRKPRS